MKFQSFVFASTLFTFAVALTGCDEEYDPPPDCCTSGPARDQQAPVVTIETPQYPPIGPKGKITAQVQSNDTITSATVNFGSVLLQARPQSTKATLTFSGSELTQGRGDLTVRACDVSGNCGHQKLANFLVDLTPPEIATADATVVASPNGTDLRDQIAVWVRDQWVLGSVSITFQGKTLTHEFPKVYPATFGTAWDTSRVGFSAKELPEGEGDATVTARDAAGNETKSTMRIRVDATAPKVLLSSPANGMVASSKHVAVRATADEADAVLLVYAGGALVAELPNDNASIDVDLSSFSAGETTIEVSARDAAGNESNRTGVTITLP